MTGPKLQPGQVEVIREKWAKGESASEIASAMGITRHGVYYHVRGIERIPVPQRKPPKHLTKRQKREAATRFRRGESNASIAQDFGVTDSAIAAYTWRYHRRDEIRKRMLSEVIFPSLRAWMEERGETPSTLAAGVGTSRSYMYYILRGERRPSERLADRICTYTGMDQGTAFALDEGGLNNEDDI